MDIKDVTNNIAHLTEYQIDQRLEVLMRQSPYYRNLAGPHKELIMGILKEYKALIRRQIDITEMKVNRDMYQLYENRIKLNLTQYDIDNLRKILETFRGQH